MRTTAEGPAGRAALRQGSRIRRWMFVAIVILLVGAAARIFLFRTEEDQVRAVLSAAVERARVSGTDGPLARLRDVRALAGYFTEEIDFSADTGEEVKHVVKTRKELQEKALAAEGAFKTLEVMLLPARVTIDGERAEARSELHVLGSLPDVEGQFYERHGVTVGLRKIGGSWKIEKLATVNLRASGAAEDPASAAGG